MQIECIVAVSSNGIIGVNNTLPWHLPADLKRFKSITMGHPIVMGRRTFESLPAGPLPGRLNVIVTHNAHFRAEGCMVLHKPDEVFTQLAQYEKVFVIGGASLFTEFLSLSKVLHLTVIHQTFEGDTHFIYPPNAEWRLVEAEQHQPDEKNKYNYTFQTYTRSE